jgi:hypothetical protein
MAVKFWKPGDERPVATSDGISQQEKKRKRKSKRDDAIKPLDASKSITPKEGAILSSKTLNMKV